MPVKMAMYTPFLIRVFLNFYDVVIYNLSDILEIIWRDD